ncbi:MAG: hypothetical protein AB1736_00040 [Chloroflexota bacterium]
MTVRKLRRVDHSPVLAVGRVDVGDFLSLPVRLLDEPGASSPSFDVPGFDPRFGLALSPELAAVVLDALVCEFAYHPAPGERDVLCRRCDAVVTYVRGEAVEPETMEPHACSA